MGDLFWTLMNPDIYPIYAARNKHFRGKTLEYILHKKIGLTRIAAGIKKMLKKVLPQSIMNILKNTYHSKKNGA
ncbi:MAG: hypothetical protein LBQ69_00880 [Treponema sp.]|jgi:hypothetical protein|nr:hypothetical protein [Treponema sp.]